MDDLVAVVADADAEQTIQVLLEERKESLGIRPIRYRILRHVRRDPGCRRQAAELLHPVRRSSRRALIVFDHEGSGGEVIGREDLQREVQGTVAAAGWEDNVGVVVISPELEAWIWSQSAWVERILGWSERPERLRGWLQARGLWDEGHAKPRRPKEAFERAIRVAGVRRSSALFRELALRVGLNHCVDPAFENLRETLRAWFPPR
jgi:hypothetical protein